MTTLQVTRPSELQNRFRKYNIYIDNEVVGTLASGETKDFLLTGVQHSVKAKMGWYSSPEITINTNQEEIQYLKVAGNPVMRWVSLLIILPVVSIRIFVKDKLANGNTYLSISALAILVAVLMLTYGRKKYLTLRSF